MAVENLWGFAQTVSGGAEMKCARSIRVEAATTHPEPEQDRRVRARDLRADINADEAPRSAWIRRASKRFLKYFAYSRNESKGCPSHSQEIACESSRGAVRSTGEVPAGRWSGNLGGGRPRSPGSWTGESRLPSSILGRFDQGSGMGKRKGRRDGTRRPFPFPGFTERRALPSTPVQRATWRPAVPRRRRNPVRAGPDGDRIRSRWRASA